MNRHTPITGLTLLCVMALMGCDTTKPSPGPTSASAPTAAATAGSIATVAIGPAALLLGIGEKGSLSATAASADGQAIQSTATWMSSDPAIATVAADGTVRAGTAVGTALITASVGAIQSEPAYVTVATPVPGAILITDDEIVGGPTIVDPNGTGPDQPYEVVLRGVPSPAPGSIVIGTEGRSVGGKVVSATPEGSDVQVRLVMVPPTDLFTAYAFKNTLDLAQGPYEVDPSLAAGYDVVQTNNTFAFNPKTASAGTGIKLASWTPLDEGTPLQGAGAQGTQAAVGVFDDCSASAGFAAGAGLPIQLSTSPTFSMTATGTADFRSDSFNGTTITVDATPTIKLAAEFEIKSAFEAKVECKVPLVKRNFRVPGWAGLFFGGDISFGVGFELAGKVTLVSAKIGGSAQLKSDLQAKLDCPAGGDCALTGTASATTTASPTLVTPSLNQVSFDPSLNLFGFVKLKAGNADIEQLKFGAIEAKAGAELAGNLTLEALQIDNTDPTSGRSKYGLKFKAEVGPALELGEFLVFIGLKKVALLKLTFETPLGVSPTGSASADKSRYLPGQSATVTVKLDAASTVFPAAIGVYNVERVLVLRKTSLFGTEVLADEGPSATGQTDFTLTFTSAHLLDASDLFVFVVTTVLPFSHPQLEVAQVVSSAPSPILFTFAHGLDGWSKGVIGPEGSNPWGLVDNVHEGNGEAHLDGRGSGSGGKAWIDHSFTLPETVTTLTFDLSAEVIAGSSSSARVVVEFGGVSQNFNFAISNGTNHLSYKRETIDLRQWAGERVKIFVEQNYNGLGGFDKEIYVDNIRISTS